MKKWFQKIFSPNKYKSEEIKKLNLHIQLLQKRNKQLFNIVKECEWKGYNVSKGNSCLFCGGIENEHKVIHNLFNGEEEYCKMEKAILTIEYLEEKIGVFELNHKQI